MKMVSTRRLVVGIGAAVSFALAMVAGATIGSASTGGRPAAPAGQVECRGKATAVTAAANPGVHGTAVTYNADPNYWDPTPLLAVKVAVHGRTASCLVAHLSAEAQPQDNWVVFQVRVDGKPMDGHAAGLAGLTEPAVFDPDESTGVGVYRLVGHDFFASVEPGDHLVEVMYAGCCSNNPLGSGVGVENPVITLEHQ
jgi:hypothetical protein